MGAEGGIDAADSSGVGGGGDGGVAVGEVLHMVGEVLHMVGGVLHMVAHGVAHTLQIRENRHLQINIQKGVC